jgi:tetratricopeptide (TPR) repeat protein
MRLEVDAKRRVLGERARHPDDILLQGDFGVACDRLSDLKFAAGDTLGAIAEGKEGLKVVEQMYLRDPKNPASRRSMMVGSAKLARLLSVGGDRSGADRLYRRSEDLAVEAVQQFPNNTDARSDLGIVYGMRGMFLADGGAIDSALSLYGRGLRIAEDLAAADSSDVLQQSDIADGHFETGIILMKGGRYREAEDQFSDAFRRFARLAAHDKSNAETRTFMARVSRKAGDACRTMAIKSTNPEERIRWRSKGLDWYGKSLDLYRTLGGAGALAGDDLGAEAEVSRQMASLR